MRTATLDTASSRLPGYTIRRPLDPDFNTILGLIESCHQSYASNPNAIPTAQIVPWVGAIFGLYETDGPEVDCRVAVENGSDTIGGLAIWRWEFSTWYGRRAHTLCELYVTPGWRRRGVGSALLDAFLDDVRFHGSPGGAWLCEPHNEAAIAFYTAQGFAPKPVLAFGFTGFEA